MNLSIDVIIEVLKIAALVSILFVWVVRYNNIQKEFEQFNLPKWLRDIVGILKISFAVMLHSDMSVIALIGSGGISLLMIAAIFTHFRVKNKLYKMLPALTLFSINMIIFLYTL
tara:strand:+ start:695 stop:1036 length:342 start_codon:yes stop_codon:yes gene_type:complete